MKATLLGAAWLAGICLAYFSFDSIPLVLIAAACAGAITAIRLGPGWSVAACLLLLTGFARFASTEPSDETPLEETVIQLTAVVQDDPRSVGPRTAFPAHIEETSSPEWEGKSILVEAPAFHSVSYGDLFAAEGTLVPLDQDEPADRSALESGLSGRLSYPDRFDILEGGQGTWWRQPLVDLRSWASQRMDSVLPEPASGLARGMVLGERADIDRGLRKDLSDAGISHLIAISGQNIVLLAAVVTVVTAPLAGRRFAAAAAIAAALTYAGLLGAPPAILRATLMASLFVLAPVVGRQAGGIGVLMFAGLLLTAIDPQIVRDISFQLSFAAVGGLIVLAGPIAAAVTSFLSAHRLPAPAGLVDVLAVTTAAWLATLPITAISFDRLSLVGFGANPLVSALFAPMLSAALLTIPASYLPEVGQMLLSWPSWVLFEYFKGVGQTAARLPGASLDVSGFTSLHAVPVYVALLLVGWLLTRKPFIEIEKPLVLKPGPAVFIPTLLLLNSLIWPGILADRDDHLRVSFLDVGQGDSALIQTPDDHTILVDGGPDPARLVRQLDEQLGFGSRRIDLVLLTHMDADHATGIIAVLERYDVETVGWNGLHDGSALARQWLEAVDDSGATLIELQAGDRFAIGHLSFSVLWPDDSADHRSENDASLVVRVSYGESDLLLTGDIGFAAEVALLTSGVAVDAEVLKLAHHGSAGSTLREFLLAVDPDFAVIQSGASNPFGHPHPDVLSRLSAVAPAVFRNDLEGTVTLVSNGRTVWRD